VGKKIGGKGTARDGIERGPAKSEETGRGETAIAKHPKNALLGLCQGDTTRDERGKLESGRRERCDGGKLVTCRSELAVNGERAVIKEKLEKRRDATAGACRSGAAGKKWDGGGGGFGVKTENENRRMVWVRHAEGMRQKRAPKVF